MKMYWQEKKRGLDLLVEMNDGETYSVGGVRVTRRGIEALAKTNGYDPGRAVKGLNSVEEGRATSFHLKNSNWNPKYDRCRPVEFAMCSRVRQRRMAKC